MPLPHFLALLGGVIAAAALTVALALWLAPPAASDGTLAPLAALSLAALLAAALLRARR